MKDLFVAEMEVRDYECDLQGIVNNANYLHYFEHTRHLYLKSHGVSFAELHGRGIDCVVARMNLAFKTPLRPGDKFRSLLWAEKDGLKYVFHQELRIEETGKTACRVQVDVVCLVNGVLSPCPELAELLNL